MQDVKSVIIQMTITLISVQFFLLYIFAWHSLWSSSSERCTSSCLFCQWMWKLESIFYNSTCAGTNYQWNGNVGTLYMKTSCTVLKIKFAQMHGLHAADMQWLIHFCHIRLHGTYMHDSVIFHSILPSTLI